MQFYTNLNTIGETSFNELLNFHIQEGGDATMCVREYGFQVPYGVVTPLYINHMRS